MASAGGAFGGARGLQPQPPERGVFPLDHFGECKHLMALYTICLKENNNKSDRCCHLIRDYLQCRMERNLMAQQDLKDLGLSPSPLSPASSSSRPPPLQADKSEPRDKVGPPTLNSVPPAAAPQQTETESERESRLRLEKGFVAGIPRK
eukprot:TRINITY_DN6135_c0_g2_i4.p1 TRINITY_DN6135_c0_g2~~TRINITY_DN6135_c0_g2_i4.p1  ORF type:complete len:149 (-),score=34.05 TRINITY_DN6135_c0_g2_i4:130-576(-)